MAKSHPPASRRTIAFGPFRLDPEKRRLLCGEAPIELRRKAWDVLDYLSRRPGAVVTTNELLDAVWPGVAVTPQTVTNVIHELRLALSDTAGAPRWIRTIRGLGHVFLPEGPADEPDPAGTMVVVGRIPEQRCLDELWTRAQHGETQMVFVRGEPGIGKTTLVNAFVAELARAGGAGHWLGRGVALEQHGRPEGYLPLLTAIEQLATGPRARDVGALLRRSAPTWLIRIPQLLRPDERLRLEPALMGATSTRMLREGLALFRALAELAPVALIVEDLHWADAATLDLLAALARTTLATRFLVIATYRPVDAAIREHAIAALARELVRERHATDIALGPFDAETIAHYLQARLGEGTLPEAIAARLESLSAGNPLFLRGLVDELIAGGAFERRTDGWALADGAARRLAELPESLRAFVASEIARLPPELRRVVEAASVAGLDVLVPEIAAALARPLDDVAEACERLASIGRIFRRAGESGWHDGTVVGRYAFPHAAHRRIVYDGLATGDRQALHRRLALGLEAASGSRAPTLAARLAAHFDEGGMMERAVDYLDLAAAAAESRFAYGEAAAHLATAIDRLDLASAGSSRTGSLCLRLGELLVLANGYSQPEVERAYARGLAIFEREHAPLGIFTSEMGLAAVDLTRARYREARDRTHRLTAIAAGEHPTLAPIASCWAGFASSALGELARAREELEAGVAGDVDPGLPRNFSIPRMLRSQLALVCTLQGDHVLAERYADEARERSRCHGSASELAHAHLLAAERAVFLREPGGLADTNAGMAIAEMNGLVSYLALLRVYDAALRRDEPAAPRIAVVESALADRLRLGDRWHAALLLGLLAEIELASGDLTGARRHLDEAFAHATESGERYYEAELCRLRAEFALATSGGDRRDPEALRWLDRALEVAASQGARLWELRAAHRRAALVRGTEAADAAITRLAAVLTAVEPVTEVPDVRDARRLLDDLRGAG